MSPSELIAALERADLGPEEAQRLFTLAFRRYAELAHTGLEPFADPTEVTATDIVTVADKLLDAHNLEVFELALWQSWGAAPQPEARP
jgi:hypothetical protein